MKIVVGVYNQIKDRSEEYQEHMKEITFYAASLQNNFAKDIHPETLEGDDIDDIIESAAREGDWLYLCAYGYRSFNHQLVNTVVDFAIENNYSIIGHILHDDPVNDNNFYSLHHQNFLLNLKEWEECGRPNFGNHISTTTVLPVVIRTEKNIHDDYTPLEIFSLGETKDYEGPLKEGWNIISEFLKKGKQIGNFPPEIRKHKWHIYPDKEELERYLAGDTEVEITDYNQKVYLDLTSFDYATNGVYVYNTDSMETKYVKLEKEEVLDTVYAVASGWKPIALLEAATWNDKTRMVYLDYSESALNFKKWLIENWDGKNYNDTINYYIENVDNFNPLLYNHENLDLEWKRHLEFFGGEANWENLWNKYKKIEHIYLKVNLFGDLTELIDDMKSRTGSNVIWVSNSFYTEACVRNFTPKELNSKYKNFIDSVAGAGCRIEMSLLAPNSFKESQPYFYEKKNT